VEEVGQMIEYPADAISALSCGEIGLAAGAATLIIRW
jgi:hypothetical protein